jgi:hypothetical protein
LLGWEFIKTNENNGGRRNSFVHGVAGYRIMDHKCSEDMKRNGIILAQNYENKK